MGNDSVIDLLGMAVPLAVLVLLVLAVIWFKKAKNDKSKSRELLGVGGWMVLPVLGFIGTIALTLYNLIPVMWQWESLKAIFAGSTPELAELRLPTALSVIFGIGVLVSGAMCLYRVFVTKRGVRQIISIHYPVLVVAVFIDYWAEIRLAEVLPDTPADPKSLPHAVRTLFLALIWMRYFWSSERVKNTFDQQIVPVGFGGVDAPR